MRMVEHLKNLLLNLAKMETSVGEIQKYFLIVFREEKLDKELENLENLSLVGKKGWWTKAAKSIRLVFTIDKHQRAAGAVRAAGQAIHLSQPFEVVQRILSSSGDDAAFRQLPLKQVITAFLSNYFFGKSGLFWSVSAVGSGSGLRCESGF